MSYYSGSNRFPSLKPGFHIVRMETLPERSQTIRTTETTSIASDRVEFYQDDRDDRLNFEAIIRKRSQTTETIGTIEGRLSQKSPLLFQ